MYIAFLQTNISDDCMIHSSSIVGVFDSMEKAKEAALKKIAPLVFFESGQSDLFNFNKIEACRDPQVFEYKRYDVFVVKVELNKPIDFKTYLNSAYRTETSHIQWILEKDDLKSYFCQYLTDFYGTMNYSMSCADMEKLYSHLWDDPTNGYNVFFGD